MNREFVTKALDSLNNHLGSRMAFKKVVFGDFEGLSRHGRNFAFATASSAGFGNFGARGRAPSLNCS